MDIEKALAHIRSLFESRGFEIIRTYWGTLIEVKMINLGSWDEEYVAIYLNDAGQIIRIDSLLFRDGFTFVDDVSPPEWLLQLLSDSISTKAT